MPADEAPVPGFSLKRWSRRKLAASRAVAAPEPAPPAPGTVQAVRAATPSVALPPESVSTAAAAPELPAVGDLTFDSDFAAFLQPRVDKALRQQALKKLFRDPRFNVMDGLDVYIDDYSLPDPIPPGLVKEMVHARNVLDPPKTRIGADGAVEELLPAETAAGPAPSIEPGPAPAKGVIPAADAEQGVSEDPDGSASRAVAGEHRR